MRFASANLWSRDFNNDAMTNKLRTTQRAMECEILGVIFRDRFANEQLWQRTRVQDVIERITTL